jgi:hypothetical protein
VPLEGPSDLELAVRRATDPAKLLAVVAAHAHARTPTSWRAALALLALQTRGREDPASPLPSPSEHAELWDEIDTLAAERRGITLEQYRALPLRG